MPSRCSAARPGETFAQDLDGDARLEARLRRAVRQDHACSRTPSAPAAASCATARSIRGVSSSRRSKPSTHSMSMMRMPSVLDEVVQVEQVVVLDQSDARGDVGDADHVRWYSSRRRDSFPARRS